MPYDPNLHEHLSNSFPDPHSAKQNEDLSRQVANDLRHLPVAFLVWVHEDGRIFIDCDRPLSKELWDYVEAAGYEIGKQPTVGGGRVQYQIKKVIA